MRLGISSYTYSWAIGVPGHMPARPMDLMDLLDRAASFGIRVLQVADNLPLHRLPEGELQAFARQAERQCISIEVGTRGIHADHLRRSLEIAACLGSPILRVVIDSADHTPQAGEVVDLLRPWMPECVGPSGCGSGRWRN